MLNVNHLVSSSNYIIFWHNLIPRQKWLHRHEEIKVIIKDKQSCAVHVVFCTVLLFMYNTEKDKLDSETTTILIFNSK